MWKPSGITILSEDDVRSVLTPTDAMKIVTAAFTAVSTGDARNFPIVREVLPPTIFGIKSGSARSLEILGLKAGGAFPNNFAIGAPAHCSTIILFDPNFGNVCALVAGNYVTAVRTAAAAALSISLMSRPDANSLGIIGCGAQAEAHLRAALLARPFSTVRLFNRTRDRANNLKRLFAGQSNIIVEADAEAVSRQSDTIITLTSAREAVVQDDWIRPGTHLACMGADSAGKQEIAPTLLKRARIFTDDLMQAITVGECQSAHRAGLISDADIRGTLGDILNGIARGRENSSEVTLYDGTGVALQDLFAAKFALRRLNENFDHSNK